MNKNNVLGVIPACCYNECCSRLFLKLYPINDVDLTNTQVNEPAVYTPEKELSKTEYGKKLIHILDLSRSDPPFADKAGSTTSAASNKRLGHLQSVPSYDIDERGATSARH
ncbi:hypothetical protein OK016_17795 [Vibrio chagasii]|nr:hypothetical protein [Vibrio chagasii]